MPDNDNAELVKLQKTIKALEDSLAQTKASADAARARVDDLERKLNDYIAGSGGTRRLAIDGAPPLFAAMVVQIFRGGITWPVELHEVVDGIGTSRAEATIEGVPVKLMRVVHKATRRAGYVATRPDGDRLVFHVATPSGVLLALHEVDDPELVLTRDETEAGAAARDARDEARRREEEAAIKAEMQRRGARP